MRTKIFKWQILLDVASRRGELFNRRFVMTVGQFLNLLKSILHNIGVAMVGFGFAGIGRLLDSFLGLGRFRSPVAMGAACVLLAAGFFIRVWAAFLFYEQRMKVISLVPQRKLITNGPFRVSRNPLYLGGNVFTFFGASLFLGSPMGIVLTVANFFLVDWMIRREERQLERDFGDEWKRYKSRTRRWV